MDAPGVRLGRIITSVNPFIPKPGTPFQWHRMETTSELQRKMRRPERAFEFFLLDL